ncbi:hypothetical protein JCM10914A_54660 [Paenibacillus sp. JCM 10914]|uniref:flagellar biosynthesis protein FlhF n=1 Tax=Paenibacillus sp. JCM 10914 TaxID=1236974 RepID=UPI0003CCBB00|nr:flagellar biosynthesis protein FlhF [Paenibacillus sp. JCM 10914]GAE04792.1 flagellar biosynthesis protein FlhF [Paenibacillus sp. JCM 10914]
MRVKRYIVDTMPEAMQHIRTDLGAEAVILSTKETKVGGFLGMFTRKKIEVIAAIEQSESEKSNKVQAQSQNKAASVPMPTAAVPKAYQRTAAMVKPEAKSTPVTKTSASEAALEPHRESSDDFDYNRFAEILSQAAASEGRSDQRTEREAASSAEDDAHRSGTMGLGKAAEPLSDSKQDESLSARLGISESEQRVLAELKEMKEWMARLSKQNLEVQQLPEPLLALRDQLLKQELSATLAQRWLTEAEEAWKASDKQLSESELIDVVHRQAEAFIKDHSAEGVHPDTRIVYVAGPTGVGKTTTIAKIAAEQLFRHQRKVGFITSDTYRISAVEQLRTYASILNVPMEVVQSPGDMQRALQKLEHCDLILMDTAGRNYRNELLVSELQSLFSKEDQNQSETYLVLSLTSKSADMIEIADHFSKYELDKVIFTKLDETGSYGPLFNLLEAHNLRLSYMTNGQNVPDDLLMADSTRICRMLLGEKAS